jgi:hypothetical protein
VVNSPLDDLGGLVHSFVKLHGEKVAIKFEGFPYGVVAIDGVRLSVVLEQNV